MKINYVVLFKKIQFCQFGYQVIFVLVFLIFSFENDQMLNLAKFSREKRKKEKSKQRPERKR
jgi:hypothetical protein